MMGYTSQTSRLSNDTSGQQPQPPKPEPTPEPDPPKE